MVGGSLQSRKPLALGRGAVIYGHINSAEHDEDETAQWFEFRAKCNCIHVSKVAGLGSHIIFVSGYLLRLRRDCEPVEPDPANTGVGN